MPWFSLPFPLAPPRRSPSRGRGHGWLPAGLWGLWMSESGLLTRGAQGYAGVGHHGHLVVWVAGLLVAACVLPWAQPTVRAAAAVGVSWSATGWLLAAGRPVPAWGLAESAALLVLLGLVAWRSPVQAAVPLGIALAAGVLVAPARDAEVLSITVVAYALVVAGVAALGLGLRHRDEERAKAVAAAREAERLEVAGQLHDFVAHRVAAMTLLAKATGTLAEDERVAASLRDIQLAGDEALTTARRLLKVLQQDHPHRRPLPGLDRVAELVESFRSTRPGTRVGLCVDPCFDAGLAPELAASVHRIVAEALANVAKHSPGSRAVEVTLRRSGERLFASVRNAGAGSPQPPRRAPGDSGGSGGVRPTGHPLGLVGIRERADAIGGSLTAGPVPGGGWEVLAVLPVRG